jgi:NAD(P)-dependent dehydrogenase (short-subunit alcohol dehydrogenase family)
MATALIIGVGPGLGVALAQRFAGGGMAVAVVARNPPAIELPGKHLALAADAGDPASIATACDRVKAELGAPDVLVYNAGAFAMGSVVDIDPAEFERSWRINCAGALYAARRVLPDMLARGRGTVLLTGATASLRGGANFATLAVGKFGLRALAQSMARELGPRGIHVAHVVIDGQIDTPRMRQLMPGRDPATMLAPAAIAETYWQLHEQQPTAWTLELDLRPNVEKF